MKKILLLFVAILSVNTYAQDVNKIYNDYVDALGGKSKLAKVKSIQKKIVMSMPAQGMEVPMDTYQSIDGVIYTKMNMMGQEIIAVAFDGKKGFKMNQQMAYEDITPEQAEKLTNEAKDIFGSVLRYKERGDQLTYIGKETLDGIEYDALKLNLKEPIEGSITEMKVLFNPKTHLFDHIIIDMGGTKLDTKVVSYVEVDGIKFIEKLEISMNGQVAQTMTMSDIVINPPAPDSSVFNKPKE